MTGPTRLRPPAGYFELRDGGNPFGLAPCPFAVARPDRWGDRPGEPSFEDAVCWHVLLDGQAAVRAVAAEARQRLAGFGGLH